MEYIESSGHILPLPTTRKLAKQLKTKFYFTGNPCIRYHVCHRYTGDTKCIECKRFRNKRFRDYNPDYHQNWRDYNPQYYRDWREQNPGYFSDIYTRKKNPN